MAGFTHSHHHNFTGTAKNGLTGTGKIFINILIELGLLLTAPAQRSEDQADQQHDAIVAGKGLGGKGARRNQRGEPENQYDIQNISANDIADGDVIFAFSRSGDGGGQLGQAGADGNDR